jgi:quercetin dioxygenase-like cupin family protein
VTEPFQPRCLVAEVGGDGRTRFVKDELVLGAAPSYGGLELYRAWSGGTPETLPLPPGGAFRVTLVRFLAAGSAPERPFARYHWHDTVDIQILIAGELIQRLDDGSEVTLRPGDVVVQCGGSHAWEVRGEQDAIVAIVAHEARRLGPSPPDGQRFERVFPAAAGS